MNAIAPDISVCIPVHNGEQYVEDALSSIQTQTYSGIEIIASNNFSIDSTAEILAGWSEKVPMAVADTGVLLRMWPHFNLLLSRIKTPYFMFLCHDDYLNSPQALEKAAEILRARPEVSAVYCDLAYVSATGKPLAVRNFGRSGALLADDLGHQSLRVARNMFGIPLLARTAALGSYRYDERLTYLADLDLSWRISKGGAIYHIPEPLIANRYTGTNTTWSVLADAERQFLILAENHGISLSPFQLLRLKWTNWFVGQQKKIFGLYVRWKGP